LVAENTGRRERLPYNWLSEMDGDFARFEHESWQRLTDKYDSVWSSLLRLKTESNNTRQETNLFSRWPRM
jgi:hypothetical protein